MDKDSIEFSDDMRGTRMRIPSASIQNEMQRQGIALTVDAYHKHIILLFSK